MFGLLTRCERFHPALRQNGNQFELFLRRRLQRHIALVGYGAHAGLVPEMQVDLDKFGSNHSLGETVEQPIGLVLSVDGVLAAETESRAFCAQCT